MGMESEESPDITSVGGQRQTAGAQESTWSPPGSAGNPQEPGRAHEKSILCDSEDEVDF